MRVVPRPAESCVAVGMRCSSPCVSAFPRSAGRFSLPGPLPFFRCARDPGEIAWPPLALFALVEPLQALTTRRARAPRGPRRGAPPDGRAVVAAARPCAARPSRPARRGVRRVCGRNLSVITHRSFVPGIYFYRITFRGAKFFRASHKLSVTLEPLNKTWTLSAKDLDLATHISINVPSFQVFALVLQLLAPREADGNLEE